MIVLAPKKLSLSLYLILKCKNSVQVGVHGTWAIIVFAILFIILVMRLTRPAIKPLLHVINEEQDLPGGILVTCYAIGMLFVWLVTVFSLHLWFIHKEHVTKASI